VPELLEVPEPLFTVPELRYDEPEVDGRTALEPDFTAELPEPVTVPERLPETLVARL